MAFKETTISILVQITLVIIIHMQTITPIRITKKAENIHWN